jgi:tRNA (cmo5U34)-methyltransferase
MSARTAEAAWTFDGFGPEFDSHVIAHLPDYERVQAVVAAVSSFTLPDRGMVADLGASTGRTIAILADRHPTRRITAHLYDADTTMLDSGHSRLDEIDTVTAKYHVGDLTDPDTWRHQGADLTIALWILQFLHPADRLPLLARARERAAEHGAILIGAKTRHTDPRWQEIADAALVDYKATAGVTPEEITAKARSLRGVLIPDTAPTIGQQLAASGWHAPTVIQSWHTWVLIGAWASPISTRSEP